MGQIPHRADILDITSAIPCQVTTTEEHGYATHDFVRLTDLGPIKTPPGPRGMDVLNNNRYRIIVTGVDTFALQDPITYEPIDSTNFPPYVTGGFCNLIETSFVYHSDDEEEE